LHHGGAVAPLDRSASSTRAVEALDSVYALPQEHGGPVDNNVADCELLPQRRQAAHRCSMELQDYQIKF